MTTWTPATAEMEKWIRIRICTNFWLRLRFRCQAKFQTCYCLSVILLFRIKK